MEAVAEIGRRRQETEDRGWSPLSSGCHAFRPYAPPPSSSSSSVAAAASATAATDRSQFLSTRRPPPLLVNHPIVVKLTKDIVETYQSCHPSFAYSEANNPPKRYLTNPSNPASNGGLDNENSDLILAVNGVLVNGDTNHRYSIKELLGQGTFGQVAKCWSEQMESFVAVKIIKNQPAYRQQALVEISILNMLNEKYDPGDKNHIVRILEHFMHEEHLCIVFEMLGINLFELLKANSFKGLSLNLIRTFTKQILTALSVLRDASVIHCDLKPENILLTTRLESAELKLIDFGSACREFRTVYSYIQSRFYRSPEVVIGHEYTTAIDMWSFGCVAAELFLGLPLFPAQSQYDLLQRMIKILGDKPPDHILRHAKNTNKYFKLSGGFPRHNDFGGQYSTYQFLTPEEYELREKSKPVLGKHYFGEDWDLKRIIMGYHMRKGMSPEEIERERHKRLVFMDFLRGLVHFDPLKRWTPWQAAQHPFVTDEPFEGSFEPPPEAPRMPIHQGMIVDHNPVSGHWFGAGLSPQVSNNVLQFGSPQYHGHNNLSFGSSYGSVGSFGSYGDGNGGHGNSFGSYGDASGMHMNSRALSAMVNPGFGISPDPRRRVAHMPVNHALGHSHLGFSPSTSSYMPMSLGVSPSNFTPPSSHFQHSPGSPSTGSPRGFGPTSPARSSALGKAAALGQYSKRMGWGSPGSGTNPSGGNRNVGADSPTFWHGAHPNSPSGNSESNPHAESPVQTSQLSSPRGSSHHASQFKPRSSNQASKSSNFLQTNANVLTKIQSTSVDGDDTLSPPASGDFNPEYSEELLFEHDGAENVGINLGPAATGLLGPMANEMHGSGSLALDDRGARLHMALQDGLQSAVLRQGTMLVDSNLHFPHYTWNPARPPHHGHHFNQISPSRLGQQPMQFLHPHQQQHQMQYRPSNPYQWEPHPYNQYHPQGQRNGSLSVAFPSPFARKD